MNNFVIGLKRFFTNKNVVTIILVIVILVVLYYGYSSTIKKQTNPVSIPVAAREIPAQTLITNEDIRITKVANSMVGEKVVRSAEYVKGKYTKVGVTIPEGSVFYTEWLDTAENIPGNWIEQLGEDERGYYMPVDIDSTLGNSVVPNSYVDIYMKATDEKGVMFGKLLKNVKVLVVHDSQGKNVFSGSNADAIPARIGFGVDADTYILLHKIEYLYDVSLIIAPRGMTVPTEDYVIVTSSTLRDYVDTRANTVEEDVITKEETEPSPFSGTNPTPVVPTV